MADLKLGAVLTGPLLGGALIGLAASLFLLANGRVAGISGILASLFVREGDKRANVAFLVGLILAGAVFAVLEPSSFAPSPRPLGVLALAGMFVGFGTRLGSGCTSGHGVCGLSRGSGRSLVATGVFMLVAVVTVFVLRRLGVPSS